jgi:hypothetical protein
MSDVRADWLADIRVQFEKLKSSAEAAVAQVDDAGFFAAPDAENNSIAIDLKHMGGNLRSRFGDFLTTDGEKPDRDRDGEFEIRPGETRAVILDQWAHGWATLFATIDSLRPDDLTRTVRVRGEPHSVMQALHRALSHQAYHVGQVVLLARHHCGESWKTLTIPRGGSAAFLARMQAAHSKR